jgi:hypothetical protein
MSTDRDVTRIVRSWLHEDAYEDADRILNLVLDEIDTTPQRRSSWSAWRRPFMNTYLKVGLAAAVVVLAALIGIQLLGGSNIGEPGPSSSGSSAEPTPSEPGPSASIDTGFVLWAGDAPGEVPIIVTIPAGWSGDQTYGVLEKGVNGGDPPAGAGIIVFEGGLYVYGDPCHWESTKPATAGTTVDELVAALAAQASRDASDPVDVTVGGYTGKSITLHVPDDVAFSAGEFTDCDQGNFSSFGSDAEPGPARFAQGPGQIDEVWILDVNGVVVVIDTGYYALTPADDVAELRAIVESATFEMP